MIAVSRKILGSRVTAVLRTMDSGEDLLTFITGSTGGRNAIAKLLGKVARSPNAVAGKMPGLAFERAVLGSPRETNGADRLVGRAAARARGAAYRDGDLRVAVRDRAGNHFARRRFGYRAVLP